MTYQGTLGSRQTGGSANAAGSITVGMGDLGVSRSPAGLVTYALGSCIAVCVFDPVSKIGGMIHYVLPDSTIDKARARTQPAMFADTGLPELMAQLAQAGASARGLQAKVIGGASITGAPQVFNVGKRNVMAAKKLMWKHNLRIVGSEVGGNISRTVRLDTTTGRVRVTTPGMPPREL